jgi:hypothetical protein
MGKVKGINSYLIGITLMMPAVAKRECFQKGERTLWRR